MRRGITCPIVTERSAVCCEILDRIVDGIFTIDKEKKLLFMNLAAEKITGFSREEAIGKFCFDILRSNICQTRCTLDQTFETGKDLVGISAVIINKKGKEIPISINTTLLKDESGEIIGGIEMFRDLTVEETLRRELKRSYSFYDMISKNHRMHKIFNMLPDIADSGVAVLIEGASGTGKELLAKAIHELSSRNSKPIIMVNCAAIPETLLESELFGYKKGAFTDAKRDKPGWFAAAEGGTLLLDEIGEMALSVQAKLLRVLEEKVYVPLGGIDSIPADVRIIAATNKNLFQMVQQGLFREDLYYRLAVVKIELPPLKERKEDIPILIDHFIQKLNVLRGKDISGISEDALSLLMQYNFPGNIRELENILEYAFILCKENVIGIEHLPEEVVAEMVKNKTKKEELSDFDKQYAENIIEVLKKYNGNKMLTAKELKISRTTLWRKLKKYGIN